MSELNFNDFFKEITKRIDGKKSTDDIFVNVERNLGNDVWDTELETDFHTGLWFNNRNDIIDQTKKKSSFIKSHLPEILGCICGLLMTFFIFYSFFHLISKTYNSSNIENKKIYIERKVDNYDSPSVY